MIRFLVNHVRYEVAELAPTVSILDWLRTEIKQTGTKEGCASGDCGACTVIVGEQTAKGVEYFTVNSCLLLVGNVHGKHIITVDSLTSSHHLALESLHPVQRAMVECHGSQCGFCTPGFIMSMYSVYELNQSYPGDEAIMEALGGNLCRCTGYKPIIDACKKMFDYPRWPSAFTESASAFFEGEPIPEGLLTFGEQKMFIPQTLQRLLALKAEYPQAKLIAGGTDLSLEFTQMLKDHEVIISVAQVPELKGYAEQDGKIRIGAGTPYSEFVDVFCKQYPEAKELFHRLGSQQIRNVGTVGGSLGNASPIGDPAPLFIALDAVVILASEAAERSVPMADFFTGYRKTLIAENEVITAVELPMRSSEQKLACYKISKRMEDDISAVLFAMAYQVTDGVISAVKTGFGGMAATPLAAKHLEQALIGQPFSLSTLQAAGAALDLDFKPMSDVRASSDYRMMVTKNLLTRLWFEQDGEAKVRVEHAAL